MALARNGRKSSFFIVAVGFILFVIGVVFDVSIAGLPEGIGLDLIGFLVILYGLGLGIRL